MILDKTTRSIVAVLGAAKTTNDCAFVSTTVQTILQRTAPQMWLTLSNGVAEVEIIAAPEASMSRLVREITFDNVDTVDQTVHIAVKDGVTLYPVIDMLVPHGRTLQFQDGYGWSLVPLT